MIRIDKLIEENNVLVKDIGMARSKFGEHYFFNEGMTSKIKRYLEIQEIIKLNTRAEKEKDKSKIRAFITQNKEEILKANNNQCNVCKFSFKEVLHVHHIKPLSNGGDNSLDNLAVLCPNCHALVHNLKKNQNKERDVERNNFKIFSEWCDENIRKSETKKLIELSFEMPKDRC